MLGGEKIFIIMKAKTVKLNFLVLMKTAYGISKDKRIEIIPATISDEYIGYKSKI